MFNDSNVTTSALVDMGVVCIAFICIAFICIAIFIFLLKAHLCAVTEAVKLLNMTNQSILTPI